MRVAECGHRGGNGAVGEVVRTDGTTVRGVIGEVEPLAVTVVAGPDLLAEARIVPGREVERVVAVEDEREAVHLLAEVRREFVRVAAGLGGGRAPERIVEG